MTDPQFAFVAILLLVIICSGCAMLYLLLRNTRFDGGSSGASSGDITNMMILFQSMRETVDQQKELARQFNLSIDRKVSDVRDALENSGNLKKQVAEAQSEIDALVKDTKEQLASLNRRMEYLKDKAPGEVAAEVEAMEAGAPEVMADSADVAVDEVEPETVSDDVSARSESNGARDVVAEYDGRSKLPPLNAIASSAPKKRDFIDNWAGVDFGVKEAAEPAHVPEPSEPENAEESRDAFRTLLNLKHTESHADFTETSSPSASNDAISPVQRRIYEFSDAGMRVPEIARELGVGKGEVKLILNMRDEQA